MLMLFGLLLSAAYPILHIILRKEFKVLPDEQVLSKAKKRVLLPFLIFLDELVLYLDARYHGHQNYILPRDALQL